MVAVPTICREVLEGEQVDSFRSSGCWSAPINCGFREYARKILFLVRPDRVATMLFDCFTVIAIFQVLLTSIGADS
jgi:hypothetical protein